MRPSPYNHAPDGHGASAHGREAEPKDGAAMVMPPGPRGDGDGGRPRRGALDGQRSDEQLLADYRAGD